MFLKSKFRIASPAKMVTRATKLSQANKATVVDVISSNSGFNNNAKPVARKMQAKSSVVRKLDLGDDVAVARSEVDEDVLITVHAVEDDYEMFQSEGSDDEQVDVGNNATETMVEPPRNVMDSIDVNAIRSAPVFKEMVNQAVAEQLRQERLKEDTVDLNLLMNQSANIDNAVLDREITVTQNPGLIQMGGKADKSAKRSQLNNVVNNKSPSDTTIYAPALAHTPVRNNNGPVDTTGTVGTESAVTADVMQKISEFLAQMQIQNSEAIMPPSVSVQRNLDMADGRDPQPGTSGMGVHQLRLVISNAVPWNRPGLFQKR